MHGYFQDTKEFYPTPRPLADRMAAKLSKEARYFLEPSAGKGDLAEAIQRSRSGYTRNRDVTVDCIEINPELAAILASKDGLTVVGSDWLTYEGTSYYDAIVMNPPFSHGDEHLLRAWQFLYEGEILCLLNSETLTNRCTETRQLLGRIVDEHGTIEELDLAFSQGAERRTDVRVSLVHLHRKAEEENTAELWQTDTPERPPDEGIDDERQMLAVIDKLGNMQHHYDQANANMLKAFQYVRRAAVYLKANGLSASDYTDCLKEAVSSHTHARAEFLVKHRQKAWQAAFGMLDFHRWLDRKQQEKFARDIARDANIPFTKENVKGTLQNIFAERKRLFEQSVANVYDELTKFHKENTCHTEGWKTNDSYKVNQKLVFPWGCRYDDKWGSFSLYWHQDSIDIYHDLDRILCVLSGRDFSKMYGTVYETLNRRFNQLGHQTKGHLDNYLESDFFEIRFFKKGTVHLRFKDAKLWERFNITASKGKMWLGHNTQGHQETVVTPPEGYAESEFSEVSA